MGYSYRPISGVTLIQSKPELFLKRRVSTPNGVTEVVEGEPFHILLANFSPPRPNGSEGTGGRVCYADTLDR